MQVHTITDIVKQVREKSQQEATALERSVKTITGVWWGCGCGINRFYVAKKSLSILPMKFQVNWSFVFRRKSSK